MYNVYERIISLKGACSIWSSKLLFDSKVYDFAKAVVRQQRDTAKLTGISSSLPSYFYFFKSVASFPIRLKIGPSEFSVVRTFFRSFIYLLSIRATTKLISSFRISATSIYRLFIGFYILDTFKSAFVSIFICGCSGFPFSFSERVLRTSFSYKSKQ